MVKYYIHSVDSDLLIPRVDDKATTPAYPNQLIFHYNRNNSPRPPYLGTTLAPLNMASITKSSGPKGKRIKTLSLSRNHGRPLCYDIKTTTLPESFAHLLPFEKPRSAQRTSYLCMPDLRKGYLQVFSRESVEKERQRYRFRKGVRLRRKRSKERIIPL